MSQQRLFSLLRCLECGERLSHGEEKLICAGCGETYPLRDGIPVMVRKDSEDALWEDYFCRVSSRMGDTEAANRYFSRGNFRFVRRHLLELIGPVKGQTILDAGCGTGHFAAALTPDHLVVGVDISLAMLGFARKKGLAVVQASAKKLPFDANTFDLVIANNVIQSIREGAAFVRELHRVTRPGGKVMVSTTNGANPSLKILRPFERKKHGQLEVYSLDDLTRFCTMAHLTVELMLFLFYPFGLANRIKGDSRPRLLERRFSTSLAILASKPGTNRTP